MRTSSTVPAESLVDIEAEVMCVTCKIPLNIAESPQPTRERDLIRWLIDRGLDKPQIKAALVDEFGPEFSRCPTVTGSA